MSNSLASKKKLAVVIPAKNEELVIKKTLTALLKFIRAADIYLIDDGSTDKTSDLALNYLASSNILTNKSSQGKTRSLNKAMDYFNLTERYKYVLPLDADTAITPSLVRIAVDYFEKDTLGSSCAVVGKVRSIPNSWIPYFRIWEYEISQAIIKKAQSLLNVIHVCSGCSTVYRTSLFKKTQFSEDTLAEDMDLTFEIHRKKLGKVVYADKGVVYTQDPKTLKAYTKQLLRWYTGFWQCIIKHSVPWGGDLLDLEVAMLALGGLLNSFIVGFVIFYIPSLMHNLDIYAKTFIADLVLFQLPTVAYAGYKNKTWKIFLYIPSFYFLRLYSGVLFFFSFLNVFLRAEAKSWDRTQRYLLEENK